MNLTRPFITIIKSLIALTFLLQLIGCQSSDDFTTSANTTSNASTLGSDAILSWVAPAERTDNTSLSMAEIAGYRIYYGTAQGSYSQNVMINDAYADEYNLSSINLPAGTYYAVMTTVDSDGRESSYSQEVVFYV